MRLNTYEIGMIRKEAASIFGDEVKVLLFGSRVNDTAKGGDVDLLVQTSDPVLRPAACAAQLSAAVTIAMHGRSS